MSGITVNLLFAINGTIYETTTTNATGYYLFSIILPGNYSAQFIKPAGYVFSPFQNANSVSNPLNGTTNIFAVNSGTTSNLNQNAGLVALSSVGNFVWNDANNDGVENVGELGICGVPVALFFSNGSIYCNTTTNATGYYLFSNVVPGNYTAQFTKPVGFVFSPFQNDSAVSDPTTGNTNSFVVTSGSTITSVNAGLVALSSVGDFVWNDANNNGLVDNGELGMSGVTVSLLFSNGSVYCTAVTNSTGYYLFSNVVPGTYIAQFTKPAGYVFSPFQNANTVSNANNGTTNSFTVVSGSTITTINAGLYLLPTTTAKGQTSPINSSAKFTSDIFLVLGSLICILLN